MKLIVHIGPHKTGTSALQVFLSKNRDKLRKKGVWYAPPAGHTNHTPTAFAFQGAHKHGPNEIRSNLEQARAKGCHICLLSSEEFCGHPFDISQFETAIEGCETTVIAYMRRADELLASAYGEIVRNPVRKWRKRFADQEPYVGMRCEQRVDCSRQEQRAC